MYLLLGLNTTNLYIRNFCYLVNTLINKANIYIKEKSKLYLVSLLFSLLLIVVESSIFHNLTSKQSVRKFTT